MRETSSVKNAFGAFVLCCCAFFGAPLVFAEDVPTSVEYSSPVKDLGLTEVEAASSFSPKLAESAVELTPESWEGRGMSAAELLSTLPGIQYYRQGGLGSFQTVSFRGMRAKSVIVCLDGIPLNDAGGGAVDLGRIDLNQIEKIEVYKDRVPAKFGGSGVGGAVNFVTKGVAPSVDSSVSDGLRNGNRNSGRILASYGSHNSWEGSILARLQPTDSVVFTSSITTRHSDNDYEFLNRNGTPYDKSDDFTDKRRNAEFTEHSGLFKAKVLHTNGVFSNVSAQIDYSEGGNPGREDYQTSVAGFEGERIQVSYMADLPELFDFLWLSLGTSGVFEKSLSHSYYPLDHIGYYSSEFLEYGSAGYELLPVLLASYLGDDLEANVRLAGGYDYYEARGNSKGWNLGRYSFNASFDAEYRLWKYVALGAEGSSLYLKDDIQGGKFVLPTMSTNLESAKEQDASFSGRGFVRIGGSLPFGMNASVGRFYREPQLMELYGVYPGVVSNPELDEETAVRMEILAYAMSPSRKTSLRTTYFETRSENGIYWMVSGAFMKPMNIGEAFIRGLEAELESAPVKFAKIVLRATWQDAKDRSESQVYRGKKLPYEPAQSYLAEMTLWLPFHFDFTWTSEYRTKIYCDRANRMEQNASAFHRASLGFKPYALTRVVFAVENISDETYRNEYTPYPMPGREYKLTITQGF